MKPRANYSQPSDTLAEDSSFSRFNPREASEQPSFRAGASWPRGAIFALVIILSTFSLACLLKRGWVPHDEGILAQSAEHVLRGEVPHRDYIDIYTGGLTYLNALAFRLFGVSLSSMRYVLFLFFFVWVCAFYYVARNFVSPTVAGGVTLLAATWSVPNYPAPMPSWYNLFFATFGLAFLLRYIESERRIWLFAAGLCGGISILFKVTGLYFVAGGLLFLVFREQTGERSPNRNSSPALYRALVFVSLVVFEFVVFFTLRKVGGATTFVYFGGPVVAVGVVLIWFEYRNGQYRTARFRYLASELAPFLAGVAVVVALFLLPYAMTGSLSDLTGGVSQSVGGHLNYVFERPSTVKFAFGAIIDLLLTFAFFKSSSISKRTIFAVSILVPPCALLAARYWPYADRAIWGAMWSLLPIVVGTGTVFVAIWSAHGRLDNKERQKLFAVLSVAAICSLIQFPFTIPIYYCFVAPLAFLSVAGLLAKLPHVSKWLVASSLWFALAYILLIVMPGFIVKMAQAYRPNRQLAKLPIERAGGLRVYPGEAREYAELVALIRAHSRSAYIYAAPECPEVYFLSGSQDPMPLGMVSGDSDEEVKRIVDALRRHQINLVVLNQAPQFSGAPSATLEVVMKREFPFTETSGNFEVRWR
jgi:hypothetical protein